MEDPTEAQNPIESILLKDDNIDEIVEKTHYRRKDLRRMLSEDKAHNKVTVICYISKENWKIIGKQLPGLAESAGISQAAFLNRIEREIKEKSEATSAYITNIMREAEKMGIAQEEKQLMVEGGEG